VEVADYIAQFLADRGIRHVFVISGGASLHLIHAIERTPGIDFVCPQHEQAGAMAADGYARVTRGLGAAMATSGPGATNMITGVCGAYFDSVPVIYVTGQVSTFRLRRDTGVRQLGFQETDVVTMYRPVTKYAVLLEDATRIRYEFEKACHLATTGRPGPVLIDVPDDLQRAEIDPAALEGFVPAAPSLPPLALAEEVRRILPLIERARRPVLILGWGVRLAGADALAQKLVDTLGIPVLLTWAALDLLPSDHPLVVGSFGTHGTRYGNFTVQNADLVLAVGARLDTRETGGLATFAREASKIVVDIDPCELGKLSELTAPLVRITADAAAFLRELERQAADIRRLPRPHWMKRIAGWKATYPICPPENWADEDVNPYAFVKTLAAESSAGDTLVVDTGCAVAWMAQAFEFKTGQRLIHDFNNTAMGWALPAAIGASIALGKRPITCVTGDGSLQMNIQELATVVRHRLPIRIFLLNNRGHSMIQQTQDQWLDSEYLASTVDGGLAFPDWERVAAAYGYQVVTIDANRALGAGVREVLASDGPVFCNVVLRPEHRVVPQVKFGRAIEDGEPLLDRREFLTNMIVRPHAASLPETIAASAPKPRPARRRPRAPHVITAEPLS
jgi:acetolactate synthase-1/2/3 large subunit